MIGAPGQPEEEVWSVKACQEDVVYYEDTPDKYSKFTCCAEAEGGQ